MSDVIHSLEHKVQWLLEQLRAKFGLTHPSLLATDEEREAAKARQPRGPMNPFFVSDGIEQPPPPISPQEAQANSEGPVNAPHEPTDATFENEAAQHREVAEGSQEQAVEVSGRDLEVGPVHDDVLGESAKGEPVKGEDK